MKCDCLAKARPDERFDHFICSICKQPWVFDSKRYWRRDDMANDAFMKMCESMSTVWADGMREEVKLRPISGFPDYQVSDDGRVWVHHGSECIEIGTYDNDKRDAWLRGPEGWELVEVKKIVQQVFGGG